MLLFVRRLDRYKVLIQKGDAQGAISRMQEYVKEGLRLDSDFAKVASYVHLIDETMEMAISELRKGNGKRALELIDFIKKKHLRSLHAAAHRLARQEIDFEKL